MEFIYILYGIYWFEYVEEFFYSWMEIDSILMYDLFCVVEFHLHAFIKKACMWFIQGNGFSFLFLRQSLSGISIRVVLGS